MSKTVKFGGSSVANAKQFKKVKKIIDADPERMFIVTSACGKDGVDQAKITDLLYLCYAHIKYGVEVDSIFKLIVDRYQSINDELNLNLDLDSEFNKIRSSFSKSMNVDTLACKGEYLTALCLAKYLKVPFVDASKVVALHYDGTIDIERTKELMAPYVALHEKMVIPGFYGCLPNGVIKVLPRGGSDITGALIANVTDSSIYENWTDVSGFLVADPKIISHPESIARVTYSELREMSYMGARVLQEEAIFPVKQKHIPINIRNTNQPDHPGTLIMEDCSQEDAITPPPAITGITGKKHFTVLTINKNRISGEVGFLRKVLAIFENHRISIESVPVSVDSISCVVETEQIQDCLYEILFELKDKLHCEDIQISDHLALLCVVGRNMKSKIGMSGKIFAELGNQGINIRTINQGSDEISIIVGIDDMNFEKAIKCIYDRFIIAEEPK